MYKYQIRKIESLKKEINVPADKSISHRALMLSSIAKGQTIIKPFLKSDDTLATLDCMEKLGVKADIREDGSLVVEGAGKHFPVSKKIILDARESGTTIRILSGLLCAQKLSVEFRASPSLKKRPMGRIIHPLRDMGANIKGQIHESNARHLTGEYPPLLINITKDGIKGINIKMPIASAQVKSAIMLAALYADKETVVEEPYKSRDHTERMLKLFGADVRVKNNTIFCKPVNELKSPGNIFVPSDFSSAAFFIVLGLILKNTVLTIKDVNTNPTRSGMLEVLKRMGANIEILNEKKASESYADIRVKSSELKGTEVRPEEIPLMIDEIPIFCVAAAFAQGQTSIFGTEELRVKETDRMDSIAQNLQAAGVNIGISDSLSVSTDAAGKSAIIIEGGNPLKRADFKSFGDHRTTMSSVILGAAIGGDCSVDDVKCIDKSFPGFVSLFESL